MATAWLLKVHEDDTAEDDDDRAVMKEEREITLSLVKYKTPMAALSFPRYVNRSTDMKAAAPALEISRLLYLLGLGTDALRAFAPVPLTAALRFFNLDSSVDRLFSMVSPHEY